MKPLAEIKIEVDRRATLIGATGHHSLPTYGRTEDGARPHIEVDWRGYHLVVVERGQEQERFTTRDLDELLYRIFQSVTHELAFAYELAHRVETRDCRRLAFQRQVELLSQLSASWAQRQALEHDHIPREHPFDDMAGNQGVERGRSLTTVGLADGVPEVSFARSSMSLFTTNRPLNSAAELGR